MRKRFSADEKLEAVKRRFEGKESINKIAKSIGVDQSTVDRWIVKYESMGTEAFSQSSRKKYSLELKKEAVEFRVFEKPYPHDNLEFIFSNPHDNLDYHNFTVLTCSGQPGSRNHRISFTLYLFLNLLDKYASV